MSSDLTTVGELIYKESGALIRLISFCSEFTSADEAANDFVAQLGYNPLPRAWNRLDLSDAHELITSLLSYRMAYGCSLMAPAEASKTAEVLISSFSKDVICLSNGVSKFKDGKMVSQSYHPINREVTFDRGVIFLDEGIGAILWQEDVD